MKNNKKKKQLQIAKAWQKHENIQFKIKLN